MFLFMFIRLEGPSLSQADKRASSNTAISSQLIKFIFTFDECEILKKSK